METIGDNPDKDVTSTLYKTPDEFDDIVLNSDGEYLTGLWFVNSKDSRKHIINCEEKELSIFL